MKKSRQKNKRQPRSQRQAAVTRSRMSARKGDASTAVPARERATTAAAKGAEMKRRRLHSLGQVKPLMGAETDIADEYIGIYESLDGYGKVVNDDRKGVREILIPEGSEKGASQGDRVAARITGTIPSGRSRPSSDVEMVGEVVEVLGAGGDLAVAEKALIRRLGLRTVFNKGQLAAAARLNTPVNESDFEGRMDLRSSCLVTIDGEDTRDIDDAISISIKDKAWELGVHIADVSHYVKEGSSLDKEAYARGTSVYFPDQVLPMLPPALSNGICSLNQGVDRLAVSCIMRIDYSGNLTDYEISPSIIHVCERLTYTQVQSYLDRRGWSTREALATIATPPDRSRVAASSRDTEADAEKAFRDARVGQMLLDTAALSMALRRRRLERGALDFDFPECKITLGNDGNASELTRKDRRLSDMLIEELMIAANETVASHCEKAGLPLPYRNHGRPEGDKLNDLEAALQGFGVSMKRSRQPGSKASLAKELQGILNVAKGSTKEVPIATLILRAMEHADYGTANKGHFGLASDCYCHFTSPIRRYPDLMVHRMIKKASSVKAFPLRQQNALKAKMEQQCVEASFLERRAEEAERKADSLWKASYMSRFIDEEFDGLITGVTEFAVFVGLENTAEGMLHVSKLPGYYEYDARAMALIRNSDKHMYRVGDPVKVVLESVDVAQGYINFRL